MIDLTKPRWDQGTYMGRLKHFLYVTNPLNCLATDAQLDKAKEVVESFKRSGSMPSGYNEDQLWAAKYLYDSAFHPDTGEKLIVFGRMSAQAPMNTLITGCMITFYRTTAATVFWQWINQTFNAVVNYSNRSGKTVIPPSQLMLSYVCACSGALGTALFLNSKVKHMNPLLGRLVPFAAVAAANCINIPMMRSSELINGSEMFTKDGAFVGNSRRAAAMGIGLVCFSRICMAVPGMTITPYLTNKATLRGTFNKYPKAGPLVFQLGLVGLCVTFATPAACALFKQQASMKVGTLEPKLREVVQKNYPSEKYLVFNKGL